MYPYTRPCIPATPYIHPVTSSALTALLGDRRSFFFKGRHEWAGHIFDWEEAQREQAYWDRYENHGEECICGICYWMGTDTKDCVGNAGSRNVFLNGVYDHERQRLMDELLEDQAFCGFLGDYRVLLYQDASKFSEGCSYEMPSMGNKSLRTKIMFPV